MRKRTQQERDEARYYRKEYGSRLVKRVRSAIQNTKDQVRATGKAPCRTGIGAILAAFNGKCAICDAADRDMGQRSLLRMDHCHITGVFRAWLCHQCNVAIGMANESPERLERMAEWLRENEIKTSVFVYATHEMQ